MIYLVQGRSGDNCEDYESWNVCAYTSRSAALDHCRRANEREQKLHHDFNFEEWYELYLVDKAPFNEFDTQREITYAEAAYGVVDVPIFVDLSDFLTFLAELATQKGAGAQTSSPGNG